MDVTNSRIAILVDGDNAQPKSLKLILEEISAKYGKATIRRIYGDWTKEGMRRWKDLLNELSFSPIQKFEYTTGKNSTDGALIIDAMDILHSKSVNGFCIVSSDSDFTGLAKRIREEGVLVIGMGRKSTPQAFVQSCEVFTFIENLISTSLEEIEEGTESIKKTSSPKTIDKTKAKKQTKTPAATITSTRVKKQEKEIARVEIPVELLKKAFDSIANESEEAHIAELGVAIRRIDPSFDVRTYGFSSLSKFLQSVNEFEIKKNEVGGLNHPIIKKRASL